MDITIDQTSKTQRTIQGERESVFFVKRSCLEDERLRQGAIPQPVGCTNIELSLENMYAAQFGEGDLVLDSRHWLKMTDFSTLTIRRHVLVRDSDKSDKESRTH